MSSRAARDRLILEKAGILGLPPTLISVLGNEGYRPSFPTHPYLKAMLISDIRAEVSDNGIVAAASLKKILDTVNGMKPPTRNSNPSVPQGSSNPLTLQLTPELSSPKLQPPDPAKLSPDEVVDCQNMLKTLGYYEGAADGRLNADVLQGVRTLFADSFPGLGFDGKNVEGELAVAGKSALLKLVYDLTLYSEILHGMDQPKRLALLNSGGAAIGFERNGAAFDIYVDAKQIGDGSSVLVPKQPGKGKVVEQGSLMLIKYHPRRKRNKIELVSGEAAVKYLHDYSLEKVKQYSEGRLQTIAFIPDGERTKVFTSSGDFSLSPDEVKQLTAGERLSDQHELSRLIKDLDKQAVLVWTSPMSQRSAGARQRLDRLSSGVQRAYAEAHFVRSDLADPGAYGRLAKMLDSEVTARDVYVVIDAERRTEDYAVIPNMQGPLRARGLNVINYTPGQRFPTRDGKVVIVITGHIGEEMRRFVKDLSNDGYFKGNYVIFNSCYDPAGLTDRMAAEMVQKYGAEAVFRPDTKISPEQVGRFVMGMAQTLGDGSPVKLPGLILWNVRTIHGLSLSHLRSLDEKFQLLSPHAGD